MAKKAKKSGGSKYHIVSLLDVNDLLTFAKEEVKTLKEEITEEQRVEKELKEFIATIEKHSGHKIHYMGHEKRFGKHLVRFMFKKGGFLEVMVEKPLALNAHFINKSQADDFASGLKKALKEVLPDSPVKDIFIESIKVEDGHQKQLLSVDKWAMLHKITIHRTIVVTVVAAILVLIMEFFKEFFVMKAKLAMEEDSIIISIVTAIIIVLFFEPVKSKVEKVLGKLMGI